MSENKKIAAGNKLTYKGTVTIKTIDKKGKVKSVSKHNEGRQGLFNLLLFTLAYKYNTNYTPFTIMGYTDKDSKDHIASSKAFSDYVDILHSPVLYNAEGVMTSTIPVSKVQYSFLVTAAKILSGSKIQSLKLINKNFRDLNLNDASGVNDEFVCAYLELKDALNIQSGENLLVYWDLEFSVVSTES